MIPDHDFLTENLKRSSTSVAIKAYGYNLQGIYTWTPPFVGWYKEGEGELCDYQDNGDIFVFREGRADRMEVKHLSRDFTCYEDWPFKGPKGPEMIVMAQPAFDRADWSIHSVTCFSKNLRHMTILHPSRELKKAWWVDRRTDRRPGANGLKQNYYFAPLGHATFHQTPERILDVVLQSRDHHGKSHP